MLEVPKTSSTCSVNSPNSNSCVLLAAAEQKGRAVTCVPTSTRQRTEVSTLPTAMFVSRGVTFRVFAKERLNFQGEIDLLVQTLKLVSRSCQNNNPCRGSSSVIMLVLQSINNH